MATRNPRRRCRNCPEPDKQGLPPPEPAVPLTATYQGEGDRLWHHALYACATLVELLFGYVAMDVPGDPLPKMKRLQARLGEIIQTREDRTRETSRPQ
jgi:hypothetical protein